MKPLGYWAPVWGAGCPTGYGYTYARVVLGWAGLHHGWKQHVDVSPTVTWRNSRHPSLIDPHYGMPRLPVLFVGVKDHGPTTH